MAVFVAGAVGVLCFYACVLAVGVWAGTRRRDGGQEEMFLAGRAVGLGLGALTLIATWVGGGYVNGAAEIMFSKGLLWCQTPIGYSLSLLAAMAFTEPMRRERYVTMLDPFQKKYGARIGGLLFLPALCGDVFWCASILSALGSSLSVILGLDSTLSVVVSALFAGTYTVAGGFYGVAYTDVIQLACIAFGLGLSAPFAWTSGLPRAAAVSDDSRLVVAPNDWLGHVSGLEAGLWVDYMLLLVLGGIPWQGYFQRILCMKSTRLAHRLSVLAFFGCLLMAVPSCLIGFVARETDWSQIEGFGRNVTSHEAGMILPLALRHLTPAWVSFFGLGAVSAAVMSSADSSILASSTMFSRNIYQQAIRPKASETEVVWVLRIAVIVITALATVVALTVGSVYYLSYLSADLVYVILFPQLLLIVFWPDGVNTYGCLASFVTGATVRIAAGEPGIGIPAAIRFPLYDHVTSTQRFPTRTAAMLCTLATHAAVSLAAKALFRSGRRRRYDFLGAFQGDKHGRPAQPSDGGGGGGSRDEEAVEMRTTLLSTGKRVT